jgi:hypothetical protein
MCSAASHPARRNPSRKTNPDYRLGGPVNETGCAFVPECRTPGNNWTASVSYRGWIGKLYRPQCTASPLLKRQPEKALKVFKAAFLIAILAPYILVAGDNEPHMKSETLLRSSSALDGVPYAAYPKGAPEL